MMEMETSYCQAPIINPTATHTCIPFFFFIPFTSPEARETNHPRKRPFHPANLLISLLFN